MSHNKLRKETDCLNCGAQVTGRYCANCGQENVEPKQTFGHLLTHFFNDITHFDGKFFVTAKTLLFKPGFLSEEYLKGRRMKYLDPVRMYLFISAAFFITFFAVNKSTEFVTRESDPLKYYLTDSVLKSKEAEHFKGFTSFTIQGKKIWLLNVDSMHRFGMKYYDSVQKTLPTKFKSSGIERYFEEKLVAIWPVYLADRYNFMDKVNEKFYHSLSKIVFISLPFFALFLYLLYIRRRKELYFVSHVIFSLHCYCVVFILWFFILLLNNKYYQAPDIVSIIAVSLIAILSIVYFYLAMKRFYKQGWFKTLIKYCLQYIASSILILVLVLGMLIKSFLDMAPH
ncbi:MAG: DUF3667 domain-containing protein [Bacteroidetes bacterium]|nr:DUF3667 domain-containing protein [Bacteroidota bacterium]